MRLVSDKTGRFRQRPHYEPKELDYECEQIITDFMRSSCGDLILPIPTDALTKLIERDVADLDLYADLSSAGADVHGVTEFFVDRKPRVRIAKELSEQERRENRLRTTLTHEYGHVKFHAYLWQAESLSPGLFPQLTDNSPAMCKRDAILNAPTADWMEWQAGYACGALLMPITSIKRMVAAFCEEHGVFGRIRTGSTHDSLLRIKVGQTFNVSKEAAGVRLAKLEILTEEDPGEVLLN